MRRDRTAAAIVVRCGRLLSWTTFSVFAVDLPLFLPIYLRMYTHLRAPTGHRLSRVLYIRKWMDSGERHRMDRPTDHTSCIFFARAYFICVHMDTSHYIAATDLMVVMVLAAGCCCRRCPILMLCIGKLFFTLYRAHQVVSFRYNVISRRFKVWPTNAIFIRIFLCIFRPFRLLKCEYVFVRLHIHTDTADTWQRERPLASLWLHTYTRNEYSAVCTCVFASFLMFHPATGPTHSRTQSAHTFSLNLNEHETSWRFRRAPTDDGHCPAYIRELHDDDDDGGAPRRWFKCALANFPHSHIWRLVSNLNCPTFYVHPA